MTKKEHDHLYYLKNKDKIRIQTKKYYLENREIIKKRTRAWYEEHKNDKNFINNRKKTAKETYLKTRTEKLIWHKNYWFSMRKDLIDFMGGKCIKCGFKDIRALQIDHVNGGGKKEHKNNLLLKSPKTYKEHITKNRGDYQLLCANCNWIKRHENQENRKIKIC